MPRIAHSPYLLMRYRFGWLVCSRPSTGLLCTPVAWFFFKFAARRWQARLNTAFKAGEMSD